MKPLAPIPFSRRLFASKRTSASATLVGLLIVFVASFVLAGWAMILAARVESAELGSSAQKRRIAIQNARNIGMQWARNGLSSNSITNVAVVLANDWGQFTAANTTNGLMSGTNPPVFLNHLGPYGFGGYSTEFVTAHIASNFVGSNRFMFRSRSPFSGGYPLVGQTNTSIASSSFRRLVSPNAGDGALMFATNDTGNAVVASTYSSPVLRTVVTSLGGAALVLPSAYPFVPTASAASGTNAFNGTMTIAPPRSDVINLPSAFATTNTNSYGNNVPVINDLGDLRIVGAPSTYADTQTFQLLTTNVVSGSTTNRFLYINTITNSTATATNLSFSANNYQIEASGAYLRMRRGTNAWTTMTTTNQYLLVNHTGGNATLPNKPSDRFAIRSGTTNRAFVIMPVNPNELIALQGNHVTFNYPAVGPSEADNPDITNGAVVFQRSAYGVSGGVGFVLLPANRAGAARGAMNLFTPTNQIRIRAIVNGLPLVQISPSTDYVVESAPGVGALGFRFTDTSRLRLRANTTTVSPLLVHIQQDQAQNSGGTALADPNWRKVLLVMNHSNSINILTNSSALTFSYLDDGNLDMGVQNANSTRPIFLDVVGRSTNNTDISFLGAHDQTWQLGMTVRNADTTFLRATNTASVWTVRGGFRSNGRLRITTDTFSINLTSTNSSLESISDRVGWIETWQQ